MIFSLLKIRKKTSAVLAGIFIGAACLWGISEWQEIPPRELAILFVGTAVFILGIVLAAFLIISIFKLISQLFNRDDDAL